MIPAGRETVAALYYRVSTDEQDEKGTIENQKRYAEPWCKLNGIRIYDTYQDPAVSGTTPLAEREGGRRLLQDAAAGKFSVVLVVKLDRFARSVRVLHAGVDALDRVGVHFRSMQEPFDTGSSVGRLFLNILAALAEWERDLISERTMAGRIREVSAGKWGGGPPPYGYRLGLDGFLQIDEAEAEIVRRIFQLCVAGMGLIQIAKVLNTEGVPTPLSTRAPSRTGTAWQISTLTKILHNATYIGHGTWGKTKTLRENGQPGGYEQRPEQERIPCPAPAIIEPELFRCAGEALAARKNYSRGNANHDYLLTGILFCGCGRHFVGSAGIKAEPRYRCTSWTDPNRGPCGAKILLSHHVEPEARRLMQATMEQRDVLLDDARAFFREQIEAQLPVDEEKASLETEIANQEQRRANVLDMFQDGDITKEQRRERLAALDLQTAELIERRLRLSSREEQLERLEDRLVQMEQFLADRADQLDVPAVLREAYEKLGARLIATTRKENGKNVVTYELRLNAWTIDQAVSSFQGRSLLCNLHTAFVQVLDGGELCLRRAA